MPISIREQNKTVILKKISERGREGPTFGTNYWPVKGGENILHRFEVIMIEYLWDGNFPQPSPLPNACKREAASAKAGGREGERENEK
jgi:hypothetical protein